jgi:hypothetical protein
MSVNRSGKCKKDRKRCMGITQRGKRCKRCVIDSVWSSDYCWQHDACRNLSLKKYKYIFSYGDYINGVLVSPSQCIYWDNVVNCGSDLSKVDYNRITIKHGNYAVTFVMNINNIWHKLSDENRDDVKEYRKTANRKQYNLDNEFRTNVTITNITIPSSDNNGMDTIIQLLCYGIKLARKSSLGTCTIAYECKINDCTLVNSYGFTVKARSKDGTHELMVSSLTKINEICAKKCKEENITNFCHKLKNIKFENNINNKYTKGALKSFQEQGATLVHELQGDKMVLTKLEFADNPHITEALKNLILFIDNKKSQLKKRNTDYGIGKIYQQAFDAGLNDDGGFNLEAAQNYIRKNHM